MSVKRYEQFACVRVMIGHHDTPIRVIGDGGHCFNCTTMEEAKEAFAALVLRELCGHALEGRKARGS